MCIYYITLCVHKIQGYSALRQESPCTLSTELPYSVCIWALEFLRTRVQRVVLSCMTFVEAQPYIAGKALSSAFHRCTGRWVIGQPLWLHRLTSAHFCQTDDQSRVNDWSSHSHISKKSLSLEYGYPLPSSTISFVNESVFCILDSTSTSHVWYTDLTETIGSWS